MATIDMTRPRRMNQILQMRQIIRRKGGNISEAMTPMQERVPIVKDVTKIPVDYLSLNYSIPCDVESI